MRSSRETSPHRDFSTLELRTPSDDLSCLLLLVGWQILSSRSQLYWSYVSYVLMSTIVESGIRQRIPFAPTTWLDDAFALRSGARLTCESVGSCVWAVVHGSHPGGGGQNHSAGADIRRSQCHRTKDESCRRRWRTGEVGGGIGESRPAVATVN